MYCIYICVSVFMYACMYVCVCVCVCMCVCVYACMYVCVYVHVYQCMYACICACTYVCMYVCILVCMCVWIYVCVFVNECTTCALQYELAAARVLPEALQFFFNFDNPIFRAKLVYSGQGRHQDTEVCLVAFRVCVSVSAWHLPAFVLYAPCQKYYTERVYERMCLVLLCVCVCWY